MYGLFCVCKLFCVSIPCVCVDGSPLTKSCVVDLSVRRQEAVMWWVVSETVCGYAPFCKVGTSSIKHHITSGGGTLFISSEIALILRKYALDRLLYNYTQDKINAPIASINFQFKFQINLCLYKSLYKF